MSVKDGVQIAFDMYELVFTDYKNSKNYERNRRHVGHPDSVEHDFLEREKEHLALLRSNLTVEIAKQNHSILREASASSASLGRKVFALNIVLVVLTAVMAIAPWVHNG